MDKIHFIGKIHIIAGKTVIFLATILFTFIFFSDEGSRIAVRCFSYRQTGQEFQNYAFFISCAFLVVAAIVWVFTRSPTKKNSMQNKKTEEFIFVRESGNRQQPPHSSISINEDKKLKKIRFVAIFISFSLCVVFFYRTDMQRSILNSNCMIDMHEFIRREDIQRIDLNSSVFLNLVKVEAGSFTMSATDGENLNDEISHTATITQDFYIGKYEITQEQWEAVMGSNPSYSKGNKLPVEHVSWHDAMEFCEKLNEQGKAPSGYHFTLPTETQWEYAARGGKKSQGYKYSGSNTAGEVAWYDENSGSKTHEVGTKKPNELWLYDMNGNVWEWCLDDYTDDSRNAKAEFTRGKDSSSSDRVFRGGSCGNYSMFCRVAIRRDFSPSSKNNDLGFRVALVPEKY